MADQPRFADTLLITPNVIHNLGVLSFNRIFASLIAGLALGVVGYAGWSGFLWYFLAHALRFAVPMYTSIFGLPATQVGTLLRYKAGKDMKPYFQSQWQVYTHEVVSSTSFLTFVLFWTLAYSCIHLF